MNIFAIDSDPILAADLPDKLVVKMCVETAQLLSTALHTTGLESDRLYKPSHLNHPSGIWTRSSSANFEWLLWHGESLCTQYSKRYKKIHSSQAVIEFCHPFIYRFPRKTLTPFALAMPDEFKSDDPHASYRRYLTSKPYFEHGWKHSIRPYYPEWVDLP